MEWEVLRGTVGMPLGGGWGVSGWRWMGRTAPGWHWLACWQRDMKTDRRTRAGGPSQVWRQVEGDFRIWKSELMLDRRITSMCFADGERRGVGSCRYRRVETVLRRLQGLGLGGPSREMASWVTGQEGVQEVIRSESGTF